MLSTETESSRVPQLKWSQTSHSVTFVIRILHNKDTTYTPTILCENNTFKFNATVESVHYKLETVLFENVSNCSWNFLSNGSILCKLQKEDENTWLYPFQKNAFKSFIAVDWDRWTTEDESEEDTPPPQQQQGGHMPDFSSM